MMVVQLRNESCWATRTFLTLPFGKSRPASMPKRSAHEISIDHKVRLCLRVPG